MSVTKQAYTRKRVSSYNMEDATYDIDCLARFLLKDDDETIEECALRTIRRFNRFKLNECMPGILRTRAAVAELILRKHADPFQHIREAGALLRRES